MIGRFEELELQELTFYIYKGFLIYRDTFFYIGKDLVSLYTANKYWSDLVSEAWRQFISERFCYTPKYDDDDYKRSALQYCIYRFKVLINEDIKNKKGNNNGF